MKTIGSVVLAVIGTAVAFSLLPQSKAVPVPSSSVGRYAITHTYENRAMMLDTTTGAVWEFRFGNYCRSKTSPYDVRQIEIAEQCKDSEDSFSNLTEFQRISVEGLYKTPIQELIDQSFHEQAKRAR